MLTVYGQSCEWMVRCGEGDGDDSPSNSRQLANVLQVHQVIMLTRNPLKSSARILASQGQGHCAAAQKPPPPFSVVSDRTRAWTTYTPHNQHARHCTETIDKRACQDAERSRTIYKAHGPSTSPITQHGSSHHQANLLAMTWPAQQTI